MLSSQSSSSSKIIKQVGKYEIFDKIIDTTEFGTIYKAQNKLINKPVMIRITSKNRLTENKQLNKDINDEFICLKSIKPDHSFPFIETLETANYIYVVMEFSDGENLQTFVKKKKNLNQLDVFSIFFQILNAYKELYIQNKCHLNINYQNIFNDKNHFKLCLNLRKYNSEQILKNHNISFISPEILKKENKLSNKADLWSFGVLLYYLSFAKLPFKGDKEEDLLSSISKFNSKGDNLSNLLSNVFKTDPNDRLTWFEFLNHDFFKELKKNFETYLITNFKKTYIDISFDMVSCSNNLKEKLTEILRNETYLNPESLILFSSLDNEYGKTAKILMNYNECLQIFKSPIHSLSRQVSQKIKIKTEIDFEDNPNPESDLEEDESEKQEVLNSKILESLRTIAMKSSEKKNSTFKWNIMEQIKEEDWNPEELKIVLMNKFNHEFGLLNFINKKTEFLENKKLKEMKSYKFMKTSLLIYLNMRFILLERKITNKENIFGTPGWIDLTYDVRFMEKIKEILKNTVLYDFPILKKSLDENMKEVRNLIFSSSLDLSDQEKNLFAETGMTNSSRKISKDDMFYWLKKYVFNFVNEIVSMAAKEKKNQELYVKYYQIAIMTLNLYEIINFLKFDRFDGKFIYVPDEIVRKIDNMNGENVLKNFMQMLNRVNNLDDIN